MSLDQNYRALLRKSLPRRGSQGHERKKRRKVVASREDEENVADLFGGASGSDSDSSDSMEFEDVDIEEPSNVKTPTPQPKSEEGNGQSDGSDDFEDLEDVDIDAFFDQKEQQQDETFTFLINEQKEEVAKGKRKKVTTVPKAERHRRKLIHRLYLMTMIGHGVIRNRWCNDKTLQALLLENAPSAIKDHFNPNPRLLDYVKQRHFVEGLQKLVKYWRFRVMAQGLVRKDWGELLVKQEHVMRNIDLDRFRQTICSYRGSRDLGAQGFVCLLRAYGLNARLVLSLQPPDFRSITLPKDNSVEAKEDIPNIEQKPKSEFAPVFIPDSRTELLKNVRRGSSGREEREKSKKKFTFPISKFPVFWVEVWNQYLRKWITVDPMVNKSVEVMPMRKKGKFEASFLEPTYQSWYILAFDRSGGVRDVTRRYTQFYNAKTVKKRIDHLSDKDEHWYERILKAARSPRSKYGLPEIMESKEFITRDQYEGVPNNMNDFKNHPLYALESQLRKDEIIYPNDDTSKCGTFRPMNKDSVVPIFRRSHVFRLRTAKAWYLQGRVLKMGVQPLKTKEKQVSQMEDEDEDGMVRLYAEFQTQLYQAPPIVNGEITKNAFGNVEIFVPSMTPENGHLIPTSKKLPIKLIEKAARDILKIDHARAIVAFDFGESGSKGKRSPTARVGGVLIDVQYKEAMDLVLEHLIEMEHEEERRKIELTALRGWSFFLKKLMIMDRLNKQHGEVDDEAGLEQDGYYSVESDNESGGDGEYKTHESRGDRFRRRYENEQVQGVMEDEEFGGFLPDEDTVPVDVPVIDASETTTIASKETEECDHESDNGGGFLIGGDAAETPKVSDENDNTKTEESLTEDTHERLLQVNDKNLRDFGDGGFIVDEGESNSSDSSQNGGFFPPQNSADNNEPKKESVDLEAEYVRSTSSSSVKSVTPVAEIQGSIDNSILVGRSNTPEAQLISSDSMAAKIDPILEATRISQDLSERENNKRDPEKSGDFVVASKMSSTDNKTSSFEDGEIDEALQEEIAKQEAELGFEYSDSE